MVIFIKNMVCIRCKMAVESVLNNLNINYQSIGLGRVVLTEEINSDQQKVLNKALKRFELELMIDRKQILVERIKVLIIELFHSPNNNNRVKFSEYLSKNLFLEYTYLANIFSELEGGTIERFYILSRIERVKELLVYEPMLSIKEIAFELNYSSESHLCQQFKKVCGLTPSMFKKLCESDKLVWKS